MELSSFGRLLMVFGGLLVLLGGGLYLATRLHLSIGPLLPGDIFIRKGSVTFLFPLVTCVLLSLLLTLLLNFLGVLRR